MDYKQMYEELQQEFEQYKKESIKWSVEDFLDFGHEEYTITREQSQKALEQMIKNFDADLGVDWYTVQCYIEEYGTKK